MLNQVNQQDVGLKIGITGGIGSGKSTVAKIFETLGIPVFYADHAAKELMNSDPVIKKNIIDNFGAQAYINDELNRPYIATVIFKDESKRELLNSIIHPATIKAADQWMERQTAPYAIKEAALLFESGAEKHLDHVIGVSAPLPLRIKRVQKRDGLTEEEILQRMNRQMNEDEKMSRCDFVIINDEEQLVIPQVLSLHEKLLTL